MCWVDDRQGSKGNQKGKVVEPQNTREHLEQIYRGKCNSSQETGGKKGLAHVASVRKGGSRDVASERVCERDRRHALTGNPRDFPPEAEIATSESVCH